MTWKDMGKPWHDTSVEYCDVCGNLLIRRYWAFQADDGKLLRACREDDERLYRRLAAHYDEHDPARIDREQAWLRGAAR